MTACCELGDGETVNGNLDHRGICAIAQMAGISIRQLNGCQDAVVEGQREQTVLLTIDLSEKTGGVALQDALNATFG